MADKLAEIRVKYNSGHYAKRTDITVEDWCMYWLEKYASRTLSYESHYRIAGMFRRYFDSDFKNMKLQELERRHIESLYERRLKDYSYNTIHLFSAEFKRCLEAAVDEGIITHNPHNKVVLPKTNLPKKIFAYTAADQKKILIRCKRSESIYDKLFLVLIGTGMRFGEATALSWDDIDLDTGMITINKTTVRSIGGTVIKDTTKTSFGISMDFYVNPFSSFSVLCLFFTPFFG